MLCLGNYDPIQPVHLYILSFAFYSNTVCLYRQWRKTVIYSGTNHWALFRRHFDTLLTSVFVAMTLDGETSFFLSQQHKKCMSISALQSKLLAGFLYAMAEI